MKRDKDERENEEKKCFWTLKSARWISPTCFEKNPSRTNYSSIFLRKFRIWPCFQLFTWFEFDFQARGINSEIFFGRTVIHTDYSEAFMKACKDLQWDHDASTPPSRRNERSGRKSRPQSERGNSYRSRAKADCQKSGGIARRSAIVTCATCTTRWPMAWQHSRRDVARHLTDHQVFLEHWLSSSQLPRKTSQELSSLERKRWTTYSWAMFHVRSEVVQETWWWQTMKIFARIRSLRNHVKRFKSQEVFVKQENTKIPCANGTLDFLIVQDCHCWQRETSSWKMMLKSKKATKKEDEQKNRGLWLENFSIDMMKNFVWSFTTQRMTLSRSQKYVDRVRQTQTSIYNVSEHIINGLWTEAKDVNLSEEWTGSQTVYGLKLGHNYQRNNKKQKLQNGQNKMSNCKQHAAT